MSLLLSTCDTLSLLACRAPEITPPEGAAHYLARSGLRIRPVAGDGIEVAPWPFDADRLEVKFPGLTLPGGPIRDAGELEEALELAEPALYVSRITPMEA